MKASKLDINQIGIIHSFDDLELASKLLSMGITIGKEIQILRRNHSSAYIKVQSECFALRISELDEILIK